MRTRCLAGLLGLVVGLAGLRAAAAEPLRVTVSIPPLQGLAARLGGERVAVSSFMNETQDPHTFSPSPRAVASLGRSALLFTVGIDFEAAVCEKIRQAFPGVEIVDVSAGLSRSPGAACSGHGHEGHDHAEHEQDAVGDPHLWLSVPNLLHMAGRMAEALERRLPEQRQAIAANLAGLRQEFEAAHADYARRLEGLRGAVFYVYHPSFGYFARDYGLVQQAVEIDGKSPSPRQLSALIAQAGEAKVRVIVVQPQFPQRSAQILSERIGGQVIAINPLSADPLGAMGQAVAALERTQGAR